MWLWLLPGSLASVLWSHHQLSVSLSPMGDSDFLVWPVSGILHYPAPGFSSLPYSFKQIPPLQHSGEFLFSWQPLTDTGNGDTSMVFTLK